MVTWSSQSGERGTSWERTAGVMTRMPTAVQISYASPTAVINIIWGKDGEGSTEITTCMDGVF